MKNEAAKHKKDIIRSVKAVITGTLAGSAAAVVLLLICVYAVTQMKAVPYGAITPMSASAVSVGAFVGGYVCGRVNKRMGLAMGAACGAVMFLIFVGIGMAFGGSLGSVTLLRLALMITAGALGGIAGVNKRSRKR
ncbi:MAG: TIGR04086 family membrane protein [Clostridia bacterium]|nr:TIGR04086 family membrane protein [Clostridia bacterium]